MSPVDQALLDRAAGGIRLRGDSARILLKWKTEKRLRGRGKRRAA